MKQRFPLISVITLNYNQPQLTLELLESLEKLQYPHFEVLVCDMASSTDPAILTSKSFKHTRILFCSKNLGFAGGNNWGIAQAEGEYILLLNNDTTVEPDLLDTLLQPFREQQDIGVVCPKILRHDEPRVIEYAGFEPMNFYTGRTSAVGYCKEDSERFNVAGYTYGAHGCAMLFPRTLADQMGGLCEDYFLYYEEWDFTLRLKQAGYKIWYEPAARVYHKESRSVGKNNPLRDYYLTRNRILLIRRFGNLLQRAVFTLYFLLITTPVHIFRYMVTGRWKHLRHFLRAITWNLTHGSAAKMHLYSNQAW